MKRILLIPLIALATAHAQNVKVINPDTQPVPVKVTSGGGGGGSGTVTATGGSLTANSVVLGAGTTDTKVLPGFFTDGTSKLTLGSSSNVGKLSLNNFNGTATATLQPTGAPSNNVVFEIPTDVAGTSTVASRTWVLGSPAGSGVPSLVTGTGYWHSTSGVLDGASSQIPPRSVSSTTSATPTPNADITDLYILTALTDATATFGAPTGTPVAGQKLMIRITDSGGPRTLAWNSGAGGYSASTDLALPLTTTASKTMYLLFVYNATGTAKWNLLAKLDNF